MLLIFTFFSVHQLIAATSTHVGVGVESSNFVNTNHPSTSDEWMWNNFIQFSWQTPSFQFYTDAGLQLVGQREVAPVIPEFLGIFSTRHWDMTIGRQKRQWSLVDDRWMLGQIQPRWISDIFRPKTEGLTGLFFDFHLSRQTNLTFFFSGVHLPDRGPDVDTVDGRFESLSPWFVSPPRTLLLGEGSAEVDYNLNKPAVGSVIAQFSAGIQLSNKDNNGLWERAFYLAKPSNQFYLPYTASINRESMVAEIEVFPETRQQRLIGFDGGLEKRSWGVSLSTLNENTDNRSKRKTRTRVEKTEMWAVSPEVHWKYGNNVQWSVSLLQRWGGEIRTIDSLADNGFLPADMPFKQAWRLQQESQYLRKIAPWFKSESVAWIQDFAQKADWLSTSVGIEPLTNLTVEAGFDFIGVHGTSSTSGLLTDYALYDRWRVGMTYVF